METKVEVVFYNLWGREGLHERVFKYSVTQSPRFKDAVSIEANNTSFLELYSDRLNKKGYNYCDTWLRGLLRDYVKRRSWSDGDTPYYRRYYADWLNNTRWISRNNPELRKWCDDYELFMRECYSDKVAADCKANAVMTLHDALHAFCFDGSGEKVCGEHEEVTAQLASVLDWCKQHENEFKEQIINCQWKKDVEDLVVLAEYICDSYESWSHLIGFDRKTLQLFNDVAYMLDNVLIPTADERNNVVKVIINQPTQRANVDEPGRPDFSHMESFQPTSTFDIRALYSFLINEGVIRDVDERLFEDCISHAHINELWDICGKTRKRNLLQCLMKMLAQNHYPKEWIKRCADNMDKEIKNITNPTTSNATIDFEDKLRKFLKGKKY